MCSRIALSNRSNKYALGLLIVKIRVLRDVIRQDGFSDLKTMIQNKTLFILTLGN